MHLNKRSSPLAVIICLTILSIATQITFFVIYNHTSSLIDDLMNSSIAENILHAVILLPIIEFIFVQVAAYALLVAFTWFLAVSCSSKESYGFALFFWLISFLAILTLNNHYFPDSFFGSLMRSWPFYSHRANEVVLKTTIFVLLIGTLDAYYHFRKHRLVGGILALVAALFVTSFVYNRFYNSPIYHPSPTDGRPNIIIIGLDSLRPDYTGHFGNPTIHTPHIDDFLKTSVAFTDAYTPLARTFPSWVSILTAKYPKHSCARVNLGNAERVISNDNLAKHLKQAGYDTIYATDEKRFSNITRDYGFDRVLGPGMGLNDFILGGLADFPLTNLIINLPFGRFLFPYNYSNRAAAITYEPDKFLQLVKVGLHQRKAEGRNQPLFLAIHFCVSHWPFTWAQDGQADNATLGQRYYSSVERVDQQLGELMEILKQNGLLEHSLVILLSDHGTTIGLPHDRLIDNKNYHGSVAKLKLVDANKYSTAPDFSVDFKHDYNINTSYGQGTDVLSLKQYHVLLAFKNFGVPLVPRHVDNRSSLLDIAPTVLSLLNLPALENIDGMSLPLSSRVSDRISNRISEPRALASVTGATAITDKAKRPLYLESGFSISDIETNNIVVEKVLKHVIGLYTINPKTGYVYVKPEAEKAMVHSRQRAMIWGDWMLALYPPRMVTKMVPSKVQKGKLVSKNYKLPAHYVLVNLKTSQWTIGLKSDFAKSAPLTELRRRFNDFYGDEVTRT